MSFRIEEKYGRLLEKLADAYGVPKTEIVRRVLIEHIIAWSVPGFEKQPPPPDVKSLLGRKTKTKDNTV